MAKESDAQRLVYPPKAWVFIKNVHGEILNLTEYVVGGEIKRLINQVSSAEIRLRNPNMIFTTHGKEHAAFHPMDPITIFLERLPGHPVQVFTGYLDTTPYLQLFPGTVTLQASCTLKRLLYNHFQMAQAYTLAFFEHFGWKPTANGALAPGQGFALESEHEEKAQKQWEKEQKEGKITKGELKAKIEAQTKAREKTEQASGLAPEGKKKTPSAIPFSNSPGAKASNDGSFSKMVWALLYYIADWRDENIYIEAMPESVPKLISQLWTNFEQGGNDAAREELEAYWKALIGTGSHGSGGAETEGGGTTLGSPKDIKTIVPTMVRIAESKGVPPAFVLNTAYNECTFKPDEWEAGEGSSTGWFQFNMRPTGKQSEPYGGGKKYTIEQARDIGISTAAFCNAAKAKGIKPESEWEQWATATQVSIGYPHWSESMPQIKKWISEYGSVSPPAGRGNETNLEQGAGPAEEAKRAATEGKEKSGTGTNDFSGYHDPLEKCKGVVGERTDMGVDWHTAGSGEEIVAIGDGVVTAYDESFASQPKITYQITQPGPLHGQFIYYAEGITTSLRAGDKVYAGRHVATTNSQPTGLEFGYGTKSGLAAAYYEYSGQPDGFKTKFGQMFARLVIKLGGTPSSDSPGDGPVVPGGQHEIITPGPGHEESGGGEGSEAGNAMTAARAASFLSQIQYPTAEEMAKAMILGGQRSLMNAVPVMNMVQQVCESSLRSFMSLPNGDFYAFYPDYFGEFGHRAPYWEIHNIEILDGGIDLSDDNLMTHAFAVGNSTWPADEPIINEAQAGVMTIFEAFVPGVLQRNAEQVAERHQDHPELNAVKNQQEAIQFLQRYGARPNKFEVPMVYSTMFESLLAYQQFLLGWARQFKTNFSFTFMPELFPGGKVALPEHGFQMYIESVTHTWDLEGGFTTTCELTAPSVYQNDANRSAVEELPPNMVNALIEPQRGEVAHHPTAPKQRPAIPAKIEQQVGETGEDIENALKGLF